MELIEGPGWDRLERAIGGLEIACSELGIKTVMEELGVIGEARIAKAFRDQRAPQMVAPVGDAEEAADADWAPLSPKTIKRRRGSTAIPLRDRGQLYQSVTSIVAGASVEIGVGIEYGLYQHGGTDDGHVPARPFIGLDQADMTVMVERVVQHLEAAIE